MNHRHLAVISLTVFLTAQRTNQFLHHVIYVHQMHHDIRVIHLDGKIVGDIIAERGHRTVVVRATPLAEHVREAVHQHLRSRLAGIAEHQLLPCPFRLPVGIVQGGLRGRGYHYGTSVPMFLQRIQQGGGKAEVAFHKLCRVFRAVHPGQVEHEIGLPAITVQQGRVGIHIILEQLQFRSGKRMVLYLAVPDVA